MRGKQESLLKMFISPIYLPDIDASCLEALVNFAYTGELDFSSIPKTAIWPLLSACTELQMTDALHLCHDYMAGDSTSKCTRSSTTEIARNASNENRANTFLVVSGTLYILLDLIEFGALELEHSEWPD